MMIAGQETGSLVNHLYSRMNAPAPEVGVGATLLSWTDRHAGTIIEVSDKEFVVQRDIATRTDKNGMSDSQDYSYAPNPDGERYVFRRVVRGKAKGQWREHGSKDGAGVLIGKRDEHFDFCF
jgi:hypothetical protein